jgi:excinuclease ABC subunit C
MTLQDKIAKFPETSGVYLFKDANGVILYIGKAKSVRERVRNHFAGTEDPKERALISATADVEYILTDSEIEALIVEAELVRQHQPRYNIRLKDDKKFPWIKVTKEPFPRIFVTRNLADDGSKLYGPYTDAASLKHTMHLVKQVFPLRSCSHQLPENPPPRPCLNYQIGRCLAPCAGKISQTEYQTMVRMATGYLTGRGKALVKDLERLRDQAAARLDFEQAAHWRDRINNLEAVSARQKVVLRDGQDTDFIAFERSGDRMLFTVLQFRDGKLVARNDRILEVPLEEMDSDPISNFITYYYIKGLTIPINVIIQKLPKNNNLLEKWLTKIKGEKVLIKLPHTSLEKRLINLTYKQVQSKIDEFLAHREKLSSKTVKPLKELQQSLGLKEIPRLVTAFDISNLAGTDSVGSAVQFKDGRPYKTGYRQFKIGTVQGQNDVGMMREVLERYLDHLEEKGADLPDLILVDGGVPQLRAALKVREEKGYNFPVAGLAKRLEEIYLETGEVVSLPKHSSALHLVQRLRDEAHRFAQRYHHKLREKKVSHSGLEDIRGIGPKTAQKLLKAFGSAQKVREASLEELEQVVGGRVARKIISSMLSKS